MNLFERLEQTASYKRLREGVNANLHQWLLSKLQSKQTPWYIAELACGSAFGSLLFSQKPEVAVSVGLDLDLTLFDPNHSAISSSPQRLSIIQGDIYHPPFRDHVFDLVWSSSSLEHFPDGASAIRAMSSLIKPGGFLFVGVPYLRGPLALYYLTPRASWREWIGRPHSYQQLEKWCQEAGLTPCGRKTYFFRFFCGVLAEKSTAS